MAYFLLVFKRQQPKLETMGPSHLSKLTGQTILIVMRISLFIKNIPRNQSNPK